MLEEVAQVTVWLHAIGLGRLDAGVKCGRGVGPARVAGKQPVLAAHGKGPDGVLG